MCCQVRKKHVGQLISEEGRSHQSCRTVEQEAHSRESFSMVLAELAKMKARKAEKGRLSAAEKRAHAEENERGKKRKTVGEHDL